MNSPDIIKDASDALQQISDRGITVMQKVGITFASSGNGYQKGTKSSRFGRIVNSIGGSSSTYTCDYFWWNAGITAVALVGGSCGSGESCGADCLALNYSAGIADWNVGASVFLEQPIAA